MREKNSDFKLVNIERVQVEKIFKQKNAQAKTCANRKMCKWCICADRKQVEGAKQCLLKSLPAI